MRADREGVQNSPPIIVTSWYPVAQAPLVAYTLNLSSAARRHLAAADTLYDAPRHVRVAGYLYGIAAECALKSLLQDAGVRPLTKERRREDPFYAHFPELKTRLFALQLARTAISKFVEDPAFMNQWDTDMRYCKSEEINPAWVDRWRSQARDAVSAIGTLAS